MPLPLNGKHGGNNNEKFMEIAPTTAGTVVVDVDDMLPSAVTDLFPFLGGDAFPVAKHRREPFFPGDEHFGDSEEVVGLVVGDVVGDVVGEAVDDSDGPMVGDVVGAAVGAALGAALGTDEGATKGVAVGPALGDAVGAPVGAALGAALGADVGAADGAAVGDSVNCIGVQWRAVVMVSGGF
jgi:hypothetical protein